MNPQEIKIILAAIGYPVNGDSAYELIGDLHTRYGSTRVGSSINTLGNASALYVRSGNVAHLVDNPQDLQVACLHIRGLLKEREGAKLVVIPSDAKSRYIGDVTKAIEAEIESRQRLKRPLGFNLDDFPATSNGMRQQSSSGEKILDGLLSIDKSLQTKALSALRHLMGAQIPA